MPFSIGSNEFEKLPLEVRLLDLKKSRELSNKLETLKKELHRKTTPSTDASFLQQHSPLIEAENWKAEGLAKNMIVNWLRRYIFVTLPSTRPGGGYRYIQLLDFARNKDISFLGEDVCKRLSANYNTDASLIQKA